MQNKTAENILPVSFFHDLLLDSGVLRLEELGALLVPHEARCRKCDAKSIQKQEGKRRSAMVNSNIQ
jgi:hypothetical protein